MKAFICLILLISHFSIVLADKIKETESLLPKVQSIFNIQLVDEKEMA